MQPCLREWGEWIIGIIVFHTISSQTIYSWNILGPNTKETDLGLHPAWMRQTEKRWTVVLRKFLHSIQGSSVSLVKVYPLPEFLTIWTHIGRENVVQDWDNILFFLTIISQSSKQNWGEEMQTFHFGSRNILELSNAATHDFPDLFQQTFLKRS